MNIYLYQNWFKAKQKMQSEEVTLRYYSRIYKPKYNPNFGDVELQKKAHKFLKTCTDSEEWAKFAYEHGLQFQACKIDGTKIEAFLHLDVVKDITVFFLDEYLRNYMYYVFRPQKNGKYFLIGMKFWEYENENNNEKDYLKSWTYVFKTNGDVEVIEWEKGAEEECVWTSKRPLNVESNWEDRPEFDNWEGFFKLKRWKDGELDEAFKGEGAALAYTKTNYPYKALSENDKNNITIALKQAEKYQKNKEIQKAIYTLEDAFSELLKPKHNYNEAQQLLLKLIDYNLEHKNNNEAIRIVEKLEKYLNLDNEYMLPLYQAKVYFYSNQKQKARDLFNTFIDKNGIEKLTEKSEYYKIYNRI